MRRLWDFFRYDIHQGVWNLWHFFPVVWRWRGWDFSCDYDVFMRAIELHRANLIKYHNHTNWKRDAAGMDLVLLRWDLCSDPKGEHLQAHLNKYGWDRDMLRTKWDDELKVWDLLHDHLKHNARGWWD